MGLEKLIDSPEGISAKYWKIERTFVEYGEKHIVVKVSLFIDKDARDNKKRPLSEFDINFVGDSYDSIMNGGDDLNRSRLYDELKKNPMLEGATDVIE